MNISLSSPTPKFQGVTPAMRRALESGPSKMDPVTLDSQLAILENPATDHEAKITAEELFAGELEKLNNHLDGMLKAQVGYSLKKPHIDKLKAQIQTVVDRVVKSETYTPIPRGEAEAELLISIRMLKSRAVNQPNQD